MLTDKKYLHIRKLFLFFFLIFLKFYFIFKPYNIVLVLPNIKMNPPQVCPCSTSWTLLPPPSPYPPSGLAQCTSPKHPGSCIEPRLATRFIHNIIHVSMPFSQISPPSSSPTESIRLIYRELFLCRCIWILTMGFSFFIIVHLLHTFGVLLSLTGSLWQWPESKYALIPRCTLTKSAPESMYQHLLPSRGSSVSCPSCIY